MIYASADHHFGHQKIIEYEDRPFNFNIEMTAQLIDNWNRVVEPDDFVLYLGDFSFYPPNITIKIVKALRGKIIFINGNHDHRTRTFWEDKAGILKWFKRPQYIDGVWLTHSIKYGKIKLGKWTYKEIEDNFVLHGHTHSKVRQNGKLINFGVDAWNFYPVPLPAVLPIEIVNNIQDWIDEIC